MHVTVVAMNPEVQGDSKILLETWWANDSIPLRGDLWEYESRVFAVRERSWKHEDPKHQGKATVALLVEQVAGTKLIFLATTPGIVIPGPSIKAS